MKRWLLNQLNPVKTMQQMVEDRRTMTLLIVAFLLIALFA